MGRRGGRGERGAEREVRGWWRGVVGGFERGTEDTVSYFVVRFVHAFVCLKKYHL